MTDGPLPYINTWQLRGEQNMHSHICKDINTLSLTEAVFELISAGLIGPEQVYTFFHVDEVPHDDSAVPYV